MIDKSFTTLMIDFRHFSNKMQWCLYGNAACQIMTNDGMQLQTRSASNYNIRTFATGFSTFSSGDMSATTMPSGSLLRAAVLAPHHGHASPNLQVNACRYLRRSLSSFCTHTRRANSAPRHPSRQVSTGPGLCSGHSRVLRVLIILL